MKKLHLLGAVCAGAFTLIASTSQAALIDRGGGLIYDTDLDITWIADANYAKTSGYDLDGILDLTDARNFVSALNYQGHTDWRLPAAIIGNSGSLCTGYDCVSSELGHLFYTELGGTAGDFISTSTDSDLSLFKNTQRDVYWSIAENPYLLGFPAFDVRYGFQYSGSGPYQPNFYVWAVHDGDIGAVPIPAAIWLFGSGILGLASITKKSPPSIDRESI